MSLFSKLTGSQSIRLPEEESSAALEAGSEPSPGVLSKITSLFSSSNTVRIPDDENVRVPMEDPPESSVELSRWDRLMIFAVLMAGSLSCFIVSFMILPVLALKPRKFAVLSSMGSILFLCSFGVLQGFRHYLRHLFSPERLWFTLSFVLSIVLAVVGSLVLKSTILSLVSVVAQIIAMIAYTVSYFPMGRSGLRIASNVAINQVDNWLST